MKHIDVKPNTYVNSGKENNEKSPKFKIGDIIRILKYKNIFAKITLQISLETFLWLKKLKILCPEHMLLMILMEKKFLELSQKRISKTKSKRI